MQPAPFRHPLATHSEYLTPILQSNRGHTPGAFSLCQGKLVKSLVPATPSGPESPHPQPSLERFGATTKQTTTKQTTTKQTATTQTATTQAIAWQLAL